MLAANKDDTNLIRVRFRWAGNDENEEVAQKLYGFVHVQSVFEIMNIVCSDRALVFLHTSIKFVKQRIDSLKGGRCLEAALLHFSRFHVDGVLFSR